MADRPNYTVRAALEPLHLLLLLALAVSLTIALGLTGLAAAAVIETLYLVLVPRMVPYRRRVDLLSAQDALDDRPQARQLRAASLSREVRQRWQRIDGVYNHLLGHLGQLPIDRGGVEDLMDSALALAQVLQHHADEERREPLAALQAAGPSERLAERERSAAQASKAVAQLDQVEASLQRLINLGHGAALEAGPAEALDREIDLATRTAREIAQAEQIGRRT